MLYNSRILNVYLEYQKRMLDVWFAKLKILWNWASYFWSDLYNLTTTRSELDDTFNCFKTNTEIAIAIRLVSLIFITYNYCRRRLKRKLRCWCDRRRITSTLRRQSKTWPWNLMQISKNVETCRTRALRMNARWTSRSARRRDFIHSVLISVSRSVQFFYIFFPHFQ